MFHKVYRVKRRQTGFTLIEVLIVLAITSLLGVGITTAVSQSFTINTQSNARMIAVTQLKNAVDSITHDVQQAQGVTPSGGSGFPLTLTWVDWDNTTNQVTYTVTSGELVRGHSENGGEPAERTVARYIDASSSMTNCDYISGLFSYQLTASIDHFRPAIETITGTIIPRAKQ